MRRHTHLLVALAGCSILLAACGADAGTTSSVGGEPATVAEGEPTGDSMNMCAPGVTDCVDTAVGECAPGATDCTDTAFDCESDAPCNDTADEPDGGRMNPSITIVQAFGEPTPSVETAPGSVPDPQPLYLQEAVVDGAMVQVSFAGGETPCFVVDHVEVTQDADMVVVTVWTGQPDPNADCSSTLSTMQSVAVVLDADLGSRLLLDGSRMHAADNV